MYRLTLDRLRVAAITRSSQRAVLGRALTYVGHVAYDTRCWTEWLSGLLLNLDDLFSKLGTDDWEVPARSVGWTCWSTAEHIAGDFAHYAGQVAGSPQGHYAKFGFDTSRATTPDELREVVVVAGRLLIAAVHTANPQSTGWHPHGYFTPTGFAAIGAAEGLVHGHDIASALGMAWQPDPHLCAAVLAVTFPQTAGAEQQPPLNELLIQTGRGLSGTDPGRWTYGGAVRPASG